MAIDATILVLKTYKRDGVDCQEGTFCERRIDFVNERIVTG